MSLATYEADVSGIMLSITHLIPISHLLLGDIQTYLYIG